jgi:hypothetical protein
MTEHWPAVSYDRWGATCDTLHAYTQVLGKLAVELAPPEPELLHAALRLTARGWETGALPAPDGSGSLVVALDLHVHEAVVEHSRGSVQRVPLVPDRPVAEVTLDVLAAVARAGGAVHINPAPQRIRRPAGHGRLVARGRPKPGGLLRLRLPGAALSPAAARWDETLGEYILDWDDVRAAPDPHAAAVDLLRSAFHHAYRKSGWSAELGATAEGRPPPVR